MVSSVVKAWEWHTLCVLYSMLCTKQHSELIMSNCFPHIHNIDVEHSKQSNWCFWYSKQWDCDRKESTTNRIELTLCKWKWEHPCSCIQFLLISNIVRVDRLKQHWNAWHTIKLILLDTWRERMINGGMSGLCMESGWMWRNKLVLPHVNRWQHTDVAHAILIAVFPPLLYINCFPQSLSKPDMLPHLQSNWIVPGLNNLNANQWKGIYSAHYCTQFSWYE